MVETEFTVIGGSYTGLSAGVNTALTAVVGRLWLGESFHSTRLIGPALDAGGVICLNLNWR